MTLTQIPQSTIVFMHNVQIGNILIGAILWIWWRQFFTFSHTIISIICALLFKIGKDSLIQENIADSYLAFVVLMKINLVICILCVLACILIVEHSLANKVKYYLCLAYFICYFMFILLFSIQNERVIYSGGNKHIADIIAKR